jgi:hypothetical protein
MKKIAWGACALFVLAFSPAQAADEYKWIGQITEDGAALSFAIPQSDASKLDFHCDRRTKKIVVNYEHEPKDPRDGMKLTLQLSRKGNAAAANVNIATTGQRLELDDKFLLQGEIRMSPQLRRILSEGGTLLATVNGQTDEIPLDGAMQAARRLFASCP